MAGVFPKPDPLECRITNMRLGGQADGHQPNDSPPPPTIPPPPPPTDTSSEVDDSSAGGSTAGYLIAEAATLGYAGARGFMQWFAALSQRGKKWFVATAFVAFTVMVGALSPSDPVSETATQGPVQIDEGPRGQVAPTTSTTSTSTTSTTSSTTSTTLPVAAAAVDEGEEVSGAFEAVVQTVEADSTTTTSTSTTVAPATTASTQNCQGYDPCLLPGYDVDCRGGSGNGPRYSGPVRVTGSDPYDLDRDGDGFGCEDS